ncbi:probable transcription factor At1g11510 [Quercus robur]|uniref:probable transcription factor At1g11510 n=1 Tax=Quercus robur TaxID=38942 RepID=UPI00216220E3|nr:probable transcription factor At1g11510 [Quercus robur]
MTKIKRPELLPFSPSHRPIQVQIHHGFIKPSNFQNPNKFLFLSLMARKQRPSHLDDHRAVSSSAEEEEEQTLSDDDEEGEQEEEEEGGEQSSSEEQDEAAKIESLPSAPPVKPHSSSSGSETKPMEPESTRFTRSSTMKKKRPNSEMETTPSKRVKKKDPKSEGGGGGEEKKLFQRLWSDDNEIELLKGMLDYRAIHDSDPAADAAAFYEFVKKSLHVEVTKAQLVDKMKRLRKKYRNNAGRGKKGKDPTFSKPHERKTYQLSKKIWGCTATATATAADDGVSGRCLNEMLFFNKNVVLEESLIKKGLELIGQQKRLELEERWKRVELAALQTYVARTELLRDQASLILEAYKGH